MQDVESEVKDLNHKYNQKVGQLQDQSTQQFIPINLDIEEADQDSDSEPEDILALAAKRVKKKEVPTVNHSYIEYEPFTKNFYVEPPELANLTNEEVNELRDELDGIKVRGSNCPKPVKKWTHCGLPSGCVEAIKKQDIVQPTPIQSQAIPAVMAGRDVIGIAKTGSGKTLAFLLPLFRHVKDQRPLENLEGPIALILTPTRELAVQIHKVCKWFLKVLNLRAVCAYGGSPIKDNIADLKRGAEILVGTPGRMIDLLCANSGRLLNLQRVTYLVLDEADRMFDMGFEPQVMKIVNNIRPDRQTVLFSATFPRQMEALARKILRHPLEITVGGKSTVCSDVTQIVEVRESSTKLFRLLQILGEYYKDDTENSRALIFVDTHEAADNLLRDLIQKGYPCMSLHGGKDQLDRDSTIADFKEGVFQILVATSVAARGLDVKKLGLVVNYECPNHMEDYVHRVGRTGRAGNTGTAYTFITPNQERYAVDIVRALKQSNTQVPQELQSLADGFQTKVESGAAQIAGSGFGGKGLERFDKERDMVKAVQKKTYGIEDEESEDEADPDAPAAPVAQVPETATTTTTTTPPTQQQTAVQLAKEAVQRINAAVGAGLNPALSRGVNGIEFGDKKNGFNFEYEINDYPQKARWRVTNKEQINNITDATGAAITTRGSYFPAGKSPAPGSGERKLYLYIEGDSELVVHLARNEVERILKEATLAAYEQESRNVQMGLGSSGRYSVL
jgi:ATP-dependent RNA helicase DDX46/PRP5